MNNESKTVKDNLSFTEDNLSFTEDNIWQTLLQVFRTNKPRFIQYGMRDCIKKNIISREAGKYGIWKSLDIKIIDHGPVKMLNPLKECYRDNDIEDHNDEWGFKFSKVLLPDGWKLSSCECGSGMAYGKFVLHNPEGSIVEILDYFPGITL
jgi:hypothetical protein